jgi:hypothetical protein
MGLYGLLQEWLYLLADRTDDTASIVAVVA